MATPATIQQSKLLQIAPEIRKIIYSHLFEDATREVRLYNPCDGLEISPGIPTQILKVCRQLFTEASSVVGASLLGAVLKIDRYGRMPLDTTLSRPETPKQEAFLSKYGRHVTKIELDDCREDCIDVLELLRHCTGLKTLSVTCEWELELEDVADESDEWWLEDPWVAERMWELWEDSESWQEDSVWKTIMKTKKGADRQYDIEVITRYDILGAYKTLVGSISHA